MLRSALVWLGQNMSDRGQEHNRVSRTRLFSIRFIQAEGGRLQLNFRTFQRRKWSEISSLFKVRSQLILFSCLIDSVRKVRLCESGFNTGRVKTLFSVRRNAEVFSKVGVVSSPSPKKKFLEYVKN